MSINDFLYFKKGNSYILYDHLSRKILSLNKKTFNNVSEYLKNNKYTDISYSKSYSKINKLIKQYHLFFNILDHLNYNYEPANIKINKITISMTNSCNMACNYCNHNLHTFDSYNRNDYFDIEKVKKIIRNLINEKQILDDCIFSFYGGEPLLKFSLIKEIIDFINYIHQSNSYIFKIVTNGTLVSNKIINFIRERHIYLQISLDGPSKLHNINRKFKNGLPTYDQIINNIKNFTIEDKKRISYNATLQNTKNAFIAENYFKKLTNNRKNGTYFINFDYNQNINFLDNYSPIYLRFLNSIKKCNFDELFMSDIFYNNYLIKLYKIHRILSGKLLYSPYLGFCIESIFKIFISQKGNMTFCEQIFTSDDSYKLNKGNMLDINKINKYKREIYYFVKENCLSCYANPWCNICFANIAKDGKFITKKIVKYCNNSKQQFKKYIELYLKILRIDKNFIMELSKKIISMEGGKS